MSVGSPSTTTLSGLTVAWTAYGDPSGSPVLYHHGAGGSRLEASVLGPEAAQSGWRIIAIDRHGRGRTDPLASRNSMVVTC
jgi:pimeloyl-ACP methyl ester carboxylesterase